MGENIRNWHKEERIKSILLTLTNQCNLKCVYCYEKLKDKKEMSFETAKQIIDKEVALQDGFEYISFDLFGGEPLLNFELAKKVVDYIYSVQTKKKFIVFIMTNGTLVHGDIKKWLISNRGKVVCGLSLDGTRKSHNMNRTNSFDKIDINFFKSNYPMQDVKMTISNESLPYLFENVKFLHEKGFYVSCNLAYGIDWTNKKHKKILEEQLMLLINYYLEHPKFEPASILEMDITRIAIENKSKVCKKWCGVNSNMRTYDIDGKSYPCQLFMPITVGYDKQKLVDKIIFPEEISLDVIDKQCANCPCLSICPTCYGSNFIATGDIFKRDLSMCELNKIIIKARAYFKARQWELNQLKLSKSEEKALLLSLKVIQTL